MSSAELRQEIHSFIDYADERFLRLVYSMVKSEKSEVDFFSTPNDEMIHRAEKSLNSVDHGNTRNIIDFKKEVGSWKENQAIR